MFTTCDNTWYMDQRKERGILVYSVYYKYGVHNWSKPYFINFPLACFISKCLKKWKETIYLCHSTKLKVNIISFLSAIIQCATATFLSSFRMSYIILLTVQTNRAGIFTRVRMPHRFTQSQSKEFRYTLLSCISLY